MIVVRTASAYEMASIGRFIQRVGDAEGKTGFKVFVSSDTRPLAHIHIDGPNKSKRVCVTFDDPPQYFMHDTCRDTFSLAEKKAFDNFLRLPYKYPQIFRMGDLKFDVKTYWDYCVYQWKLENDEGPDNLSLAVDADGYVIFPKQPDYTQLQGS